MLKIAEVSSRFENLGVFCSKVMTAMGFDLVSKVNLNVLNIE